MITGKTVNQVRIRASIEAYIAAWNEVDPARRRALIEEACAPEFHLRTSGRAVEGRDALEAMIADYQRRRPGERAVLASAIDIQGRLFRYSGVIDGAPVPRGDALDAGECDDEGRIRVMLSFVGAALPR